jgi:hypothetical protein
MGDDVFQVGELVDPDRVAPSINLEENANFHVANNILVDVDVGELNVVFSFSGHTQVDEDDDNHEINVEDYDGTEDESIKEEEDNFD